MNTQPLKGIAASLLVITAALTISCIFNPLFFNTWVAFFLMACIPTQMVLTLVWQCKYPVLAQRLSQPMKGLLFTGISLVAGSILGLTMWMTVGGASFVTPQLIMYTIVPIATTFWFVGVWRCWPISSITSNPLLLGIGIIAVAYLGGYAIFTYFFDFSFLSNTPGYIEAIDPKGKFMAWQALSFTLTSVTIILWFIMLDWWPVTLIGATQKHPWIFSIVASIYILVTTLVIFYIAITVLKIDYVIYTVRGPVSATFGAFIILNLMQNTFFTNLKQPLRGIVLLLTCIIFAVLTQLLYEYIGRLMPGQLSSGAPDYMLETWMANAMLSVTFPLIVVFTEFFNFWPIARNRGV